MKLLKFSAGILSRSTCFLSPETGLPAGGAAADAPAKPRTLAEAGARIAALEADLVTANEARATAENNLTAATTRAETAEANLTTVTGQFEAATQAANDAQAALATANTKIGTLTGERDTAQGALATANGHVSRLEALCGVKGIDPKAAAADLGEMVDSNDVDSLRASLAGEQDPKKRADIARQIRALR